MPSKTESKFKKFFFSRWFLVSAFVITLFFIISYGRAYYQNYLVNKEIGRLQDEVRGLESKKLETIEILKYLQSSSFVEEKARTELNMGKPGEKTAIITHTRDTVDNGQEKDNLVKWDNLPNWLKWWKFFFSKNNN